MQSPRSKLFGNPSAPSSSTPVSSAFTTNSSSGSTIPRRRPRVDSDQNRSPDPTTDGRSPGSAAGFKRIRSESFFPPTSITAISRLTPGAAAAAMSAKVQGKQPEVIDLTGPGGYPGTTSGGVKSSFARAPGARKLVIKNLRTAPPPARVAEYYSIKWAELEEGLAAIFARRTPRQPLGQLYRDVEDLCRNDQAKTLGEWLERKCDAHLRGEVLRRVESEAAGAGDNHVPVLRAVLGQWKSWNAQLSLIRSTFSYLDRSYLINNHGLLQINDMGITKFKDAVAVPKRKTDNWTTPGASVLLGTCDLVDYHRRGDAMFDSTLLKESITMMHIFGVYDKAFEKLFLHKSMQYFTFFALDRSAASSLKDYISVCKRLLKAEDDRCFEYNFDSTTKRELMDKGHEILIHKYSAKLLDSGDVAKLLADNDIDSMRALYELLRLSGLQKKLKAPWEDYIRSAGAEIVSDTSRGDEMVVRLLQMRKRLDVIVRDAFEEDDDFTYGLREAFGQFINDKKSTARWDTGTSKVGEMIAKYIDMLLRGGLKTLPGSLRSDSKDRAAATMSGLGGTDDEDAELDRQLDQGLELFRFIEGKDVFEAFYKKDLARRLLMGRSASQDAERNMLTKLKSECGSSFTHNLEQMFKDQELAKDEMTAYRHWSEGSGRDGPKVDLSVSVLSAAAWPTYPDVKINLPADVAAEIVRFDTYYRNKHTGRRLTWKHNLAYCMVKARFDKGPKELLVSAFQAAVLVLFNEADEKQGGVLAYKQIRDATALQGDELDRTLQSLACGRARVLNKHPKGRDVGQDDTFTVNVKFVDPKYRVKINQVQLKETKEENRNTHERVAADRQFETQAAIVRIMKSRKTMAHAQLVAEVINQTKIRGAVDAIEIKKNIEKLIEKDYLEREGGTYTYLA